VALPYETATKTPFKDAIEVSCTFPVDGRALAVHVDPSGEVATADELVAIVTKLEPADAIPLQV
jgi:hypothetical protein